MKLNTITALMHVEINTVEDARAILDDVTNSAVPSWGNGEPISAMELFALENLANGILDPTTNDPAIIEEAEINDCYFRA